MSPDWVDYSRIAGLKREAQLKLASVRPGTFGQAGRIQGVTPSDLAVLAVWVRKGHSPAEPAPAA